MIRPFHGFTLVTLGVAAACAAIPSGDAATSVMASAETVPVGTANQDAADDPAIWRNPQDPAKSLIVATDKKGGLYVYNLKGEQLDFLARPGLNNVDLTTLTDGRILVAASDRSDPLVPAIAMAFLDPATGKLTFEKRQTLAVEGSEAYGLCMSEPLETGGFYVFSALKDGQIGRDRISYRYGYSTSSDRLATLPSQPEGCVVDMRTNTLYVGEEAAGIWAIDIKSGEKELVAPTGTGMTVPDVEGLALAPEGEDGGYLVASSQGDNAFAVYRLPGVEPIGRFRITKGALGAVEETDGIELDARSFGADFPRGLFIAQDGVNPPAAQNFKLVRWDEVLGAIEKPGAR